MVFAEPRLRGGPRGIYTRRSGPPGSRREPRGGDTVTRGMTSSSHVLKGERPMMRCVQCLDWGAPWVKDSSQVHRAAVIHGKESQGRTWSQASAALAKLHLISGSWLPRRWGVRGDTPTPSPFTHSPHPSSMCSRGCECARGCFLCA